MHNGNSAGRRLYAIPVVAELVGTGQPGQQAGTATPKDCRRFRIRSGEANPADVSFGGRPNPGFPPWKAPP